MSSRLKTLLLSLLPVATLLAGAWYWQVHYPTVPTHQPSHIIDMLAVYRHDTLFLYDDDTLP